MYAFRSAYTCSLRMLSSFLMTGGIFDSHPCLVAPESDNLLAEGTLERRFKPDLPRWWRHVGIAFFLSWDLRAIVVRTPVIAIMKWYRDVDLLVQLFKCNDTIETGYPNMCFRRFVCMMHSGLIF